jgi:hypothetical protein
MSKVGLENNCLLSHIPAMSIAQLKETADNLTPIERDWLHGYLSTLQRVHDPVFVAEMTRRLDDLEAGRGVPQAQVRELLRAKAAAEPDRGT